MMKNFETTEENGTVSDLWGRGKGSENPSQGE